MDEEQGKESSLRNLPLPAFPPQAVTMNDFYRGLESGRIAEIQSINDRRHRAGQRSAAQNPQPSPLTKRRRQELLIRVYRAGDTPAFDALEKDFFKQVDDSHTVREEM